MTKRRVIAIGNQKGGVGKTTTTLNLGAELVNRGRTVVMVDADPQHSLTTSLGVDAAGKSLAEVLGDNKPGTLKLSEAIVKTNGLGRLWLVPSDIALASAEVGMERRMGREQLLKNALAVIKADYILIDCPPSLGLLTVNALVAADAVLVPVQAEYLGLRGLALFWRSMAQVRQELNPNLSLLGVLPTMVQHTKHHELILDALKDNLPQGKVFESIPRSIKASEAHAAGRPVANLAGDNVVATAYKALAGEVDSDW